MGDHWVIFDNKQVKSATDNSGAFSVTNPDITGSGAMKVLGAGAAGSVGAIGALTVGRHLRNRKKKK